MTLVFPSPIFYKNIHCRKLFANTIWICSGLIYFINRKNHWDICRLSVRNCFFCLRHNIIICSYNNNCNVCYLCSTSTHGGKSLVTRSIQESHFSLVFQGNRICTDVLGNSSSFTFGNIRISNFIKQRSFSVIHVSHYSNNWRTIN